MPIRILTIRPELASQKFSVVLNSEVFRFRVYLNTRTDSWYFDIADSAGTAIVSGARIVVNLPLLDQYRSNPKKPLGVLYAFDALLRRLDPTSDNGFGSDILFRYAEKVSLVAVA